MSERCGVCGGRKEPWLDICSGCREANYLRRDLRQAQEELAAAKAENKRLTEEARSWRSVAERLEREKQAPKETQP